MHRWAFPRSASAPKPAPISIFFCCCCFPSRSGEWTAGKGDKDSRHGRGLPQPSQAPNAGPRRREEARQACCPTSTEGSWGSVKRSLPIHDPRAT